MAGQLSQEEVLDFLCQAGGKVPNASLLGHFRLFLRDPAASAEQLLRRRESFKRYVNSVAVVQPEGAVKYVVLRSRYRDLLGEDLSRQQGEQVVPPGTQVRDGIHSNGFTDQGECTAAPPQTGGDLITKPPQVKTWGDPSAEEHECHQPSEGTARAPPSSNTSSPQNNGDSLCRSPSVEYSNASPPVIRTSVPTDKSYHHQPNNTYLSCSRTSSPASSTSSPQNNGASLCRSPSVEYSIASPPVVRTSVPTDKSYHHQPNNTYLSSSRTSSPQNNGASLCRSPSMEYSIASPLVRTSVPPDKSYHQQPTKAYLSCSRTSSPANNTSSPQNNASSLHRSPSMEYSNATPPVVRTSVSTDKSYHHQPTNTYLSTKTTLLVSNNTSLQNNAASLHRSLSMEYSKPSPSVIRTSDTSYHQQPMNTYRSSSRTSSPQNNASSVHRSQSEDYSKSSPPVIRTLLPSDLFSHHRSVNTYLSSSRTSSPASNTSSPQNNASSLHRHPSMEYNNSSPPVIKTSPPADKSYHQQPITTYLTSLSSPSNKSNSSTSHPYHKQSSLSSSAGSLDIPEIPSHVPEGHFKVPPVGQKKTESANPAFVNATSRDQEGQKHGCYTCTELQASNFHLNSTFPTEEPKGNIDHLQDEWRMPPSSRSTMYIDSPHPLPSLLFPHESSIPLPDVQLEEYRSTSRSPTPPPPLYDIHDMWMTKMPVFKSIRCQLSLQDMEDFVDQESFGSEGSDSGEGADCDTEHNIDEDPSSDSNNDKYIHYIEQKCETTRRCPPTRRFLSINEQYEKLKSDAPMDVMGTLAVCGVESARPALMSAPYSNSPYNRKSFLTDQAPILFALAKNPPRHKMSSHMQEVMSSSDEELIERDYKRRRRPSRVKRPSITALVPPQPDVDLLLTVKPVSSNHFITYDTKDQKSLYAQSEPKVNTEFVLKKTFTYKSSTIVPLDSAEHDWGVKLASASWLQVYGLFIEDPSLALRKDFISGFTAFHWFAKHGATDMFHKFVAGAKKAGIQLDVNVKSNGGYTPLHIAAIHGHHKVAAMLVEKLNVNVKLRDNSGKRAWQYLSCNTSGEVWQLLGAPKGKTIFASRALNISNNVSTSNKSSQINRKTSLAAFLKPQHQRWKANNRPVLREREIYSD